MNTEELKNMIELYFDGELEKKKESLLFSLLGQDAEARDYFKSMSLIHNAIEQTEEEFPEELEERIFHSLKKVDTKPKQSIIKSPAAIISYSFLVILILLNIYLLGRFGSYSEKMNAVEIVVEKQNRMIELLFNSLPPTEVRAANINNNILN